MKNKIVKFAGSILFLALINTGLFSMVVIRLTAFWISWIFIQIAFLIFARIFIFSAPGQKELKFAYSETAIAGYYFITETVAGVVLMTYFAFFPVVSFVFQTVILAVFLVVFSSVKRMNQNIEAREAAAKADLHEFQSVLEFMKNIQNQVDYNAPYKKTIQHAYDAISGSQVKSSANVYEVEKCIWNLVSQLKDAVAVGEKEHINSLCKDIEDQAAERNRRLRMER